MINKNFIVFLIIVAIGMCSTIIFYFSNNLDEGLQNSVNRAYQRCNQMTDCKECIDTMTAQDGTCYWCDGKCTASADYYEGCSSSFRNCGTSITNPPLPPTTTPPTTTPPTTTPPTTTPPTTTPPTTTPPTTNPNCPTLIKLKDNTYITQQ